MAANFTPAASPEGAAESHRWDWLSAWMWPFLWILFIPIVTVPWQLALVRDLASGNPDCTTRSVMFFDGYSDNYVCPSGDILPSLLPGLLNLAAFAWVLTGRRTTQIAALVAGALGAIRLIVPVTLYWQSATVEINTGFGFWFVTGASFGYSLGLWMISGVTAVAFGFATIRPRARIASEPTATERIAVDRCAACGAPPAPDAAFCEACGSPLPTMTGPAGPQRAREGDLAGFWSRFRAYLFDSLIVGFVVQFLAGSWLPIRDGGYGVGVLGLVAILASPLYFWIGNSLGGTIGKRVAGLAVVDEAGRPPGLMRGGVRYIVSLASGLVFGLGYFWMIWDEQKQTWHDKAAGTHVVHAAHRAAANAPRPASAQK
jgi:uncharacterized RDD family membrane protein YckC